MFLVFLWFAFQRVAVPAAVPPANWHSRAKLFPELIRAPSQSRLSDAFIGLASKAFAPRRRCDEPSEKKACTKEIERTLKFQSGKNEFKRCM
jgi:hypothetical protein